MFDIQESWEMDPAYRQRQNSILQYTLQATQNPEACFTAYSSPESTSWNYPYPEISDTPLISPSTECGEYDFGFSHFAFPQPQKTLTSTPPHQDPSYSSSKSPKERTVIIESSSEPESTSPLSPSTSSPPRKTAMKHKPRKASYPKDTTPIKKNHSYVERAYRERLNDKIDALAAILFFDSMSLSSKGATKPSKCLVISRAKERLEQLEHQNNMLRRNVEGLKQQVAVLNHVAQQGGHTTHSMMHSGVELEGMGMGMGGVF